jgi:hypothetical protein
MITILIACHFVAASFWYVIYRAVEALSRLRAKR